MARIRFETAMSDWITQAHQAYFRRFPQGACPASGGNVFKIDGISHVALTNVNGLLALYKICKQRLRYVEPETLGLTENQIYCLGH